jgi:biotin-[acetyl-CoA-carboxylase] ligase BirA-like protein
MEIKHHHFSELASTQTHLVDHLTQSREYQHPVLVTANHQSAGYGRRGHSWSHQPNSLAMSFSYSIHPIPTLSTLDLAIAITDYFQQKYSIQLSLKWPNDLFFQGQKIGGVIANTYQSNILIVGLGINLLQENQTSEFYSIPISLDCKTLALELYQYLLYRSQLDAKSVKERFLQYCHHIDLLCDFEGDQFTFKAIGDCGQAILQDQQGQLKEVYSGSLLFN